MGMKPGETYYTEDQLKLIFARTRLEISFLYRMALDHLDPLHDVKIQSLIYRYLIMQARRNGNAK